MTLDELQRFCADASEPREYLQQPWTRDGYTCATNGHIIVRIPAIADIPDNADSPNNTKLFAKTAPATVWMPVPKMAMPEDVLCDWCDGTGKDTSDEQCEKCNRTGKVPDRSGIQFAGTAFAKRYLALIQGWQIAPNGLMPAWIRNDDALGLLMPMRL